MFEIIDFLIKDELEAIQGYVDAINKIKECGKIDPAVIEKLEQIKNEEYKHIEILKNIGQKSDFDEINCRRIGG